MNIIEAIKSGRPIRRSGKTFSYRSLFGETIHICNEFCDPVWFLATVHLTKEDILSDDWEIQEHEVKITARQFWNAVREAIAVIESRYIAKLMIGDRPAGPGDIELVRELAKKLGLGDTPK